MRILGIDTHGSTGGAALITDGELTAEMLLNVQATHSEQLLPTIEAVLAGAASGNNTTSPPVDAVAVSTGPGSFTGLRIGVVTAKALAYAWNLPLIGVNTLEALAYQVRPAAPVQVGMVSSRRDRVFAAAYRMPEEGSPDAYVQPPVVVSPGHYNAAEFIHTVAKLGESVAAAGEAVSTFRELLAAELGSRLVPLPPVWERLHPASIAILGGFLLAAGTVSDPHALVPEYFRKSEAEIRWESKHKS